MLKNKRFRNACIPPPHQRDTPLRGGDPELKSKHRNACIPPPDPLFNVIGGGGIRRGSGIYLYQFYLQTAGFEPAFPVWKTGILSHCTTYAFFFWI